MIKIEVNFYETPDGKFPVAEFIKAQNSKMRAKIYKEIEMLEKHGKTLRMPHSEYLGDGIFQLRTQSEGNKARILYFFVVGDAAILTNGFIKKTPRTPSKELELAKKYHNEYLRRKNCEKLP